MFQKSFDIYDLIKKSKDYESETSVLIDVLRKYGVREGSRILQIACGTGSHDKWLKGNYSVTGLDINDDFIEQAKIKNPECDYFVGDMRCYKLPAMFSASLCLYGCLSYCQSISELQITLANIASVIKQGGIILIEPWFYPDDWHPYQTHSVYQREGDVSVCRMGFGNSNGDILFHYMVGDRNGVRYFTEEYHLSLFEERELVTTLEISGFRYITKHSTENIKRGLLIAQRV